VEYEEIEIQPYISSEDGSVKLGPAFLTIPFEYIGFLVEQSEKSLLVMLYNQEMEQPENREHAVAPCILLPEKDIAKVIMALQQYLTAIRELPSSPFEADNANN